MVQIGDYVTAGLANVHEDIQGVYIANLGYGYILLQGQGNRYVCELEGAVTIPDSNLGTGDLAFVQNIRQSFQR